ncbi:butyrophilin subfamily 1 member A1-like protein [Lates japonicus]|uniref:Butyrophilin subfamily 1 member A1-like protein n=1 Tax=Lates japonicus TaxID=270547 RepID=A0AAD3NB48_LATJO|nr:butyrophilin subfamily 1 member A1-like protein [Lates japonicus]
MNLRGLFGLFLFMSATKVIGAVSEPKIYAVSTEDSVVLQCKAMNWYPQPEMEWTDGKGNIISHDSNITKNDETDGITMQDLRDQLSQLQEMEREVNRLQAEVEMYRRENQALRRLGGRCHNTTNAEPQQPNSERRCSV